MQKILIVDDQFIIRTAIRSMLEQIDKFIITEAEDGEMAINLATENEFDLMLIDIHMPKTDGATAISEVCKIKKDLPILALSGVRDKTRIAEIFSAGADGYLYKDDISVNELKAAIKSLKSGDNYLSPGLFADEIADGKTIDDIIALTIGDALTKREKGIIKELAQGLSNKEVGEKLFISDRTVAKHRENIMRKSNSHNIAELIDYAKQAGYLA
jgi:DNA-binding NarL/FixJ family response regulator